MKTLILLSLLIAAPALAELTTPPVRNVALSQFTVCGTPPAPGNDRPAPCMTNTTVTFDAETIGACDRFEVRTEPRDETTSAVILFIVKSRIENCTRPEHAPSFVTQRAHTGSVGPGAQVMLGNPLYVDVMRSIR
ncbi:MAG TPA: hypothetical protein VM598_00275 [Bdellovibrionota bacterium]|nr:hypothetical protein [Bdellovibrionota bacterium]